jgi:hypothetical protein
MVRGLSWRTDPIIGPVGHGHIPTQPFPVWHNLYQPQLKTGPFMGHQRLLAGVEVLQAGVEVPCLHRPGNWLMRQLNDELKLECKVGFIRQKGKPTAREVQ